MSCKALKTSVALCTYNGEKFLVEQLHSLINQTQLPDELVICDDGSNDKTIEIVHKFAESAPFCVRLFQNLVPLGVTYNFERAVFLCRNDIIFLCDQDDIWVPTKIERLTEFLQFNLRFQAVFSNAVLVDEYGSDLKKTIWDCVVFNEQIRSAWTNSYAFDISLLSNRIPGCTMAIRREFVRYVLPFPGAFVTCMHDWWLVLAATASNALMYIDEPLIAYRQHAGQKVGVTTRSADRSLLSDIIHRSEKQIAKLSELQDKTNFVEALIEYLTLLPYIDALSIQKAQAYKEHLQLRRNILLRSVSRFGAVLTGLLSGNYHRYARPNADWTDPWRTAVSDLVA
ncbi:dTDP-rhamnosyl transferase rfbG [Fibrisoma limi BUZ 3]|uniref:dTDP-rhamnosyl transferase rfbG n=1 Tax=Fibrisoma limi BUZ 3 TaxID=1185876 RepID=I2GH54_9BACT|nr:glycosyltransferase family 2 protein [Fibrisoma limi]CCH53229.1 dTDP-rhamnosyl transferase rfbG [Fibrisoma limi BUZ 3]